MHGGALDSQTVRLTAAPGRGVVLPYGSASGCSGEDEQRHAFVVLTRPQRVRSAYALEGIPLPETEALTCLRTTVYDGARRDCLH